MVGALDAADAARDAGRLAFGCYASANAGSRGPVTVAGVLVALTCIALRQAAGLHPY